MHHDSTLPYQPALDGLRAFAVGLVMLFHHGLTSMSGGYVGVSVFFTLSGYLITTLLLVEYERTAHIDLLRFYARRAKRLLPASVVCLAAIIVLWRLGGFATAVDLPSDVRWAALQVANWGAINQDASYAELVAGATHPTEHFWSLAIEEQFYWVWPVVVLAICRAARDTARVLALWCLAAVACGAGPLIAHRFGDDAAYWSTPARLGELLTGAALAATLRRHVLTSRLWGLVGAAGLFVVVIAAVLLPVDSGLAFDGWLGVGSLASVAVVAGLQVAGPLQKACSSAALVAVGRISYGVYLWHWPIYVLVDNRVIAHDWWRLAMRLALTFAVACASWLLVERPIRTASWRPHRVLLPAVAASLSLVVASELVNTADDRYAPRAEALEQVSVDAVIDTLAPLVTVAPVPSPSGPPPAASPAPTPSRPVRVLVVGDSTAMAMSAGLIAWAASHPDQMQVEVLAELGCGFISQSRNVRDDNGKFAHRCSELVGAELLPTVERLRPDVVALLTTMADASPRLWSDDEGPLRSDDDLYAQRASADYSKLTASLLDAGAEKVAWMMPAAPSEWFFGYLTGDVTAESWKPYRATLEAAVAVDTTRVALIDFGAWLATAEQNNDRTWRPDGLHLDPVAAELVASEFLASEFIALALTAP